MKITQKLLCSITAIVLMGASGVSLAQSYPAKTIEFVAGNPPGGSVDSTGRIIGQKLSERLGQAVIVVNKPGADGAIAAEFVARAAPDGYTLLLGASGQLVFNTLFHSNLRYNSAKDFIPITLFMESPLVLAVNSSSPVRSIKDLIALARAKPGALFYGSGNTGFQTVMEAFKKEAGVNIVHVPYKAAARLSSQRSPAKCPW
jgi:tripartite-type tricarboxylate transporter receptor subunit TctC